MPKNILFPLLAILIGMGILLPESHADTKESQMDRRIVVNLSSFELRLYEGERILFRSVAAGGKLWCRDIRRSCKTPSGHYRIGKKHGPNYRSKSYPIKCAQKEACGASMPYYLQFSGEKFGIHGGFVPREPLAHVSHSCIRIPVENAKRLFDMVSPGTPVTVLPY